MIERRYEDRIMNHESFRVMPYQAKFSSFEFYNVTFQRFQFKIIDSVFGVDQTAGIDFAEDHSCFLSPLAVGVIVRVVIMVTGTFEDRGINDRSGDIE